MGIFSFGKKDDAPTRRGANSSSSRGSRTERAERAERVERRSRRTERSGDADAMLLDPTLPEKQRARRRLVGAIALVIAAVVILPMVLDSHPKPVIDDISIDIPNHPASKPRAVADDADTQAGVAPDNPAAPEAALVASGLAPAASGTSATGAVASGGNSKNAPIAMTPAKPPAPAAVANNAPAPAESPAVRPAAKPQAASAPRLAAKPEQKPAQAAQSAAASGTETGTPAAPPGNRFAVQLGSFQDDSSAHAWETKLKAAGVPAYTERRKQADGTTRTLLRAGPFADRAAASSAIAKVREAGLTSGANNGSAQ
ncbi:SPOR domain-containing protein [Paraburkholderia bengalensis]|uniref:SPOR domain-containing protein n=1 Tax=Paraburkholderia bengalensis TaxID=2747562 RepID=A0ABU8IXK4_9BURK